MTDSLVIARGCFQEVVGDGTIQCSVLSKGCYRSPRIIWDPGLIPGFSWFSWLIVDLHWHCLRTSNLWRGRTVMFRSRIILGVNFSPVGYFSMFFSQKRFAILHFLKPSFAQFWLGKFFSPKKSPNYYINNIKSLEIKFFFEKYRQSFYSWRFKN